jgi:hypothetical protein
MFKGGLSYIKIVAKKIARYFKTQNEAVTP